MKKDNIGDLIDAIREEEHKKAREEIKHEIIDYVRTEEFTASWVHAKGVKFGDFLAQKLEEKIR